MFTRNFSGGSVRHDYKVATPGQESSQRGVRTLPYKAGYRKTRFCAHIREIYETYGKSAVVAVFDRHAKYYLDIDTLWKSHRRKFLNERPKSK